MRVGGGESQDWMKVVVRVEVTVLVTTGPVTVTVTPPPGFVTGAGVHCEYHVLTVVQVNPDTQVVGPPQPNPPPRFKKS